MQLVQVFVPVIWKDDPARFASEVSAVVQELTERFGGATSFVRGAPAGRWKNDDGEVEADDLVVVEVQVSEVSLSWWSAFQARLERRFGQDEIADPIGGPEVAFETCAEHLRAALEGVATWLEEEKISRA